MEGKAIVKRLNKGFVVTTSDGLMMAVEEKEKIVDDLKRAIDNAFTALIQRRENPAVDIEITISVKEINNA